MTKFRINNSGYYIIGKKTLIHRLVWETQHGEIPKGYDIHHVDGDKLNNSIENLQCLSHSEHLSIHMKANKRLHEWHKTKEGRKFLGAKSKKLWETREVYKLKCEQCGNAFEAKQIDRARFCDNKCEQRSRRASGVDNEERSCVICSKTFLINKYYKTKTCGYTCGSKWRTRFAKGKRHGSK